VVAEPDTEEKQKKDEEQEVDRDSEQSFPASDPPSGSAPS